MAYTSETSAHRDKVVAYCKGNGLDLGSGGDPITPTAIQVDLPNQYTPDLGGGRHPVQLRGDATDLYWFRDAVFDFVFSSHLLEDFADWEPVLREWARVIRPGGHLVVLIPDREKYPAHCRKYNQPPNAAHKHEGRPGELTEYVRRIGGFEVVRDSLADDSEDNYNIVFVARKV